MVDTCVFAVIFPSNLPFFEKFLASLKEQDYSEFHLILFNDGVAANEIEKYLNNYRLDVTTYTCSGSIADIRFQGLTIAKKSRYQFIIFADTDDVFSPGRIRICRQYLQDFDLVVNDLTLFSETEVKTDLLIEHYLAKRFINGQEIVLEDISKGNFIGLGNASVRKEILKEIKLPSDLEVVDWYLFATLLASGAKAVFTSEAVTFYRQHDLNITGLKKLNKEELLHKVEQKKNIYFYLKDVSRIFAQNYQRTEYLLHYLNSNANNLEYYYKRIVDLKPDFPIWLEEILMLDEI